MRLCGRPLGVCPHAPPPPPPPHHAPGAVQLKYRGGGSHSGARGWRTLFPPKDSHADGPSRLCTPRSCVYPCCRPPGLSPSSAGPAAGHWPVPAAHGGAPSQPPALGTGGALRASVAGRRSSDRRSVTVGRSSPDAPTGHAGGVRVLVCMDRTRPGAVWGSVTADGLPAGPGGAVAGCCVRLRPLVPLASQQPQVWRSSL